MFGEATPSRGVLAAYDKAREDMGKFCLRCNRAKQQHILVVLVTSTDDAEPITALMCPDCTYKELE